ncbi:MAG: hypothetical protein AAGG75_04170 [Bacteroidota bacterium]
MHGKKTLSLLRSLSKSELADFEKYLKLQLANQPRALQTFRYLKRFYPNFGDRKRLEIGYAYQKIFGQPISSSTNNRKNFLNILSDLNTCLKAFLILEKVNSKSLESRLLWTTILMERGLSDDFARHVSRLKTVVDQLSGKSITDHILGLITNYLFYYKVLQNKIDPEIKAIRQAINALGNFYKVVRLKLACEAVARTQLLYTQADPNPEELHQIPRPGAGSPPLLHAYYQSYQMIKTGQSTHFTELESILKKHKKEIAIEEQHILLSYLQNFNSTQIRQQNNTAWLKAHELNRFGVEQGLFVRKGLISSTQFNNIINAACKAKAYHWAFDFIEKHEGFLAEHLRDSTTQLSKAIIYYEMKHFDQVLPLTLKLKFLDAFHAIRAKSLTLIAYYELGWDENTISNFCLSFLGYLKRNRKLKKETVEATENFIKLTRALNQNRIPKQNLAKRILHTERLYFSQWLLEKAQRKKATRQ